MTCYHRNQGADEEHVTMALIDPSPDQKNRRVHKYLGISNQIRFEFSVFNVLVVKKKLTNCDNGSVKFVSKHEPTFMKKIFNYH